jgi:hypothetical protein
MALLIFYQGQQSLSVWMTIITIIVAFIGSGFVTYLFERQRGAKKIKMLKHMIIAEVKRNLGVMDTEYIRENPWVSHKTWSSFYDSNSVEVTSFRDKEIAAKIVRFYADVDLLNVRDAENKELERLYRQSSFENAELYKSTLGESKHLIRKSLIELGQEIIKSQLDAG